MAEMQIFNNPEFGQIRTVIIEEKEYFYGVDVANALLYKRPNKAITDNCKGILNQDTIKNAGGYPELLIPEGDVYRLIIKAGQQGNSKEIKEKADKFEKWIFDTVLPTIRKTGFYRQQNTGDVQGQIRLLAQGTTELYEKVGAVEKSVDSVKNELETLKNDLPILPIEAEKITNAVKAKGVHIMGGKASNAYHNRSIVQAVYCDIYGQIYRNFEIKSYKALKRCQTDKAIEIINDYKAPVMLQDRIDNENAQQKFQGIE